jgi:hypothetical protein
MAEKWADYLISAVRYNAAGTHIDKVRCHADGGDSVGAATEKTRDGVVKLLDGGTTFVTIYKDPGGASKWNRGSEVRVVIIDQTKFIRTDADRTRRDNLGELPRF